VKQSHLRIVFVFAALVLISYFILIIIGDNGLKDLNEMKQELKTIQLQNDEIEQKNIELHRKIKRLKDDPEYIENIARQELKMVGKDEVVFKFKKEDAKEDEIANY
jgi:cell division protein FtsB